jgi:putative sporulation protein YyaC
MSGSFSYEQRISLQTYSLLSIKIFCPAGGKFMSLTPGLDHKKEYEVFKVAYTEPNINEILSRQMHRIFIGVPSEREIVVVCVGTDRSTGDALGPLVGSKLEKSSCDGFHLYGTLDDPVHAINLADTLGLIKERFVSPFIIAIDACLGQLGSVGCIQIGRGPLKPGAGVNKDLPPVGDVHITGIVNVGGFMEYFVLQNTRLSLVMNMAEIIASSIYISLMNLRNFSAAPFVKLD